jgi:hypothetical protein
MRLDTAVGIATGYGLDERGGSSSPNRNKIFILSTTSRPVLGFIQPPIQWAPGTLSPEEVKLLVPEADHSPPTSAEVKDTRIYTSIPPYVFMT